MKASIVVPAFNEEAYLAAALGSIRAAAGHLREHSDTDVDVEVIVVDNNSTDKTAAVARNEGATVVREPVQGIARARNTGARHAARDVLVFVDADVAVSPTLLQVIHEAMGDPSCIGGGVDVEYRPRRLTVRLYLRAWRILGRLTGMVQGARRSSAAKTLSSGSEATTRRPGSVRTSTSTARSGSWRGRSTARSGSYVSRACDPPAGASTSGRCGAS